MTDLKVILMFACPQKLTFLQVVPCSLNFKMQLILDIEGVIDRIIFPSNSLLKVIAFGDRAVKDAMQLK